MREASLCGMEEQSKDEPMLDKLNFQGAEAKIRYGQADFQVLVPGDYVRCAVCGEKIPLDELKYWSFERQEPYLDAKASLQAEQDAKQDKT